MLQLSFLTSVAENCIFEATLTVWNNVFHLFYRYACNNISSLNYHTFFFLPAFQRAVLCRKTGPLELPRTELKSCVVACFLIKPNQHDLLTSFVIHSWMRCAAKPGRAPMVATEQFWSRSHDFGRSSKKCLSSRYLCLQLSWVMLTPHVVMWRNSPCWVCSA